MFASRTDNQAKHPDGRKSARAAPTAREEGAPEPNLVWQSLAVRAAAIQAKLAISQPDDPYEREADQVADQVMRMAAAPSDRSGLSLSSHPSRKAQRKCVSCEEEDEDRMQRKEEVGNTRLRTGSWPLGFSPINGLGQPLDSAARRYFEPRFGYDFSQIRVHTDEQAARSAQAVNARAYTIGRNVVFARSQYSPGNSIGRKLLAHELSHTIQQGQAARHVSPTLVARHSIDRAENEFGDQSRRTNSALTSFTPSETRLARDNGMDAGVGGGMDAGIADAGIRDANEVSGGVPMPDAGSTQTSSTPTAPAIPNVYEHNTELGGLSVGNFDFHFRGCRIIIWVWVKFQFEKGITPAEQTAFKSRFFTAIHGVWGNSGYHLTGTATCPCRDVPIVVHAQETTGSFYHKLVDVERTARRENVISDMNLSLATSDNRITHEFGHVLGLYDEYDGGWIENHMFWHRNRPDDPNALMNTGTELRSRYFEHYRDRAQETAGTNCEYSVSSPTPPVH
jgi:hypothetical protein